MAAIDMFLEFMVGQKASDLHLSSGNPAIYRIDGSMVRTESEPLTSEAIGELVYEIMPERNRKQFEETHDTDFAYAIEGLGRFRVNVFMDLYGIGTVMRLIPPLNVTRAQVDQALRVFAAALAASGVGREITIAALLRSRYLTASRFTSSAVTASMKRSND